MWGSCEGMVEWVFALGVGGPLGLCARARHGSTRRRRAEPADLDEKAQGPWFCCQLDIWAPPGPSDPPIGRRADAQCSIVRAERRRRCLRFDLWCLVELRGELHATRLHAEIYFAEPQIKAHFCCVDLWDLLNCVSFRFFGKKCGKTAKKRLFKRDIVTDRK